MLSVSDNQKVGILLTAFGIFFTSFGVLLFFDRGLLAIGNVSLFPCYQFDSNIFSIAAALPFGYHIGDRIS